MKSASTLLRTKELVEVVARICNQCSEAYHVALPAICRDIGNFPIGSGARNYIRRFPFCSDISAALSIVN